MLAIFTLIVTSTNTEKFNKPLLSVGLGPRGPPPLPPRKLPCAGRTSGANPKPAPARLGPPNVAAKGAAKSPLPKGLNPLPLWKFIYISDLKKATHSKT